MLAVLVVARIHYPEWVTAGATVALVVGVFVALIAFWDSRKTRHGQLIADLSRRWDEDPMVESQLLLPTHGPSGIVALIERLYTLPQPPTYQADLELYFKLQRLPSMIEAIGVLHREKALSTDVVYKMWGPIIVGAWASWKAPIEKAREFDYKGAFKYFERLATIMESELAKEAARDAKRSAKNARKAAKAAKKK